MNRDYKIISVNENQKLKQRLLDYVKTSGWRVFPFFKEQLEIGLDSIDGVQQTFILMRKTKIIGFCQFIKYESINNQSLTPWISTLFIDEEYRGNRLSGLLIENARNYAKKLGYEKLYLSTDHIQLYEKFGFKEIGLDIDKWGYPTKIYEINTDY
ncbi:GNAT family N-acetyltransferase [Tissierella sp. MSJ-40]|uniref:GNAT family N-acetyltransferase n=1 Tax=Tissierella simiarum TaxID=2841534 RepID=A0ABS6EAH0_9FIRM|nr:GNAT family N-acetyltransferase [Tissierella simiarum]MBU5439178.1 GNAT family N-acetyltransferase [Tissierella simiarum]